VEAIYIPRCPAHPSCELIFLLTLLTPLRRFVEFVVLVLAALGSLVGPAAAEEQYRAASLNLVEKVNAPPKEVRSSLRCHVGARCCCSFFGNIARTATLLSLRYTLVCSLFSALSCYCSRLRMSFAHWAPSSVCPTWSN
jgi:hypothetical protein